MPALLVVPLQLAILLVLFASSPVGAARGAFRRQLLPYLGQDGAVAEAQQPPAAPAASSDNDAMSDLNAEVASQKKVRCSERTSERATCTGRLWRRVVRTAVFCFTSTPSCFFRFPPFLRSCSSDRNRRRRTSRRSGGSPVGESSKRDRRGGWCAGIAVPDAVQRVQARAAL